MDASDTAAPSKLIADLASWVLVELYSCGFGGRRVAVGRGVAGGHRRAQTARARMLGHRPLKGHAVSPKGF